MIVHSREVRISLVNRTVQHLWWSIALSLIGATLMAGALTGYCCLCSLIHAHWNAAGAYALASTSSFVCACMLSRYRTDLVGE